MLKLYASWKQPVVLEKSCSHEALRTKTRPQYDDCRNQCMQVIREEGSFLDHECMYQSIYTAFRRTLVHIVVM